MEAISFGAAFLAGVVSFVSPCVLPMLPTFVLILAGSSNTGAAAAEGGASSSGSTLARNVLAFLLGFAVVFLALGATATVLGRFLLTHLALVEKAGAVLLALLGLFLSGIISPSFLYREWRPFLHRPSEGALGSFLLGMSFTVGWTPCTGPILAAILIYAGIKAARRVPAAGAVDGESRSQGLWLLSFYVLGFAVPFLVLALLWRRLEKSVRSLYRFLPAVQKLAGLSLIALGVMMWFGWTLRFIGWLSSFAPFSL